MDKARENNNLIHIPVLLNETIDFLSLNEGGIIFDGTFGGGGHSGEILKKIGPKGRIVAVDKDVSAIEKGKNNFKDQLDSIIFVHNDFRHVEKILKEAKITSLDGAIFDLGVSSFHLDETDRGFSFLRDSDLDMRMDQTGKLTAREVVNSFSQEMLADIIRDYGEERHARRIAKYICSFREKEEINSTTQLASIIVNSVGKFYAKQKIHPAQRTFQAIRIFVNDELEAIAEALRKIIFYLTPGSRICVISFHSLEDRIVKNIFKEEAGKKTMKILTKKPIQPKEEEIRSNSRSRSAKLRVAERIL